MKKLLTCLVAVMITTATLAEHHSSAEDEVRAASAAFIDNRTRSPEGEISTARAFETDVWQKIDGKWQIVSLHYTEIPPDE